MKHFLHRILPALVSFPLERTRERCTTARDCIRPQCTAMYVSVLYYTSLHFPVLCCNVLCWC